MLTTIAHDYPLLTTTPSMPQESHSIRQVTGSSWATTAPPYSCRSAAPTRPPHGGCGSCDCPGLRVRQVSHGSNQAGTWETSTFLWQVSWENCMENMASYAGTWGFFQGLEPSHPKSWALTWPMKNAIRRSIATSHVTIHWQLSCYVLSMGEGDNHKKSGMKYKQWKKGRRLTVIYHYITPILPLGSIFPEGKTSHNKYKTYN